MNVAGDEWRRTGLLKTLQEIVSTTGIARAEHILDGAQAAPAQHRSGEQEGTVEEFPAIPSADPVTVSLAVMEASTPAPSEVMESPSRRATMLPPLNWAKRAAASKGRHDVELHFV